MTRFDHVAIDALDAEASARFLADVLGTREPTPEGEDDDMFRVDLDDGSFVLFSPATSIAFAHVAFRVNPSRFEEIVARLRARGVAFGNDHHDPRNGATDDPLGGAGRIYFADDNGHLWEVAC
ncbi:MAG: VOC family protein [Polyangiaceae bacterium]|nr:VOC family protein [Polyangiaceae bacterium]